MEAQKQKPQLIQRLHFNQLLRHKTRLLRLKDYLHGQLKVYEKNEEPIKNFLDNAPLRFIESKQGYNFQIQIHNPFLEKYEKTRAILSKLDAKLSEIETRITGGQELLTLGEKPLYYDSIYFDKLKLVKIRKEKGLSQAEFALQIGIAHKETISRWERGLAEPSFKMLYIYLEAVGVDVGTAYNNISPYLETYKSNKNSEFAIIDTFKRYRERILGKSERKSHMTQKELAEKMGISYKTLQDIEGLRLNLLDSLVIAYKVTLTLGCKLSDLYENLTCKI